MMKNLDVASSDSESLKTPTSLREVIERFNQSTDKLEGYHLELQREIDNLREQLRQKEAEIKQKARLAMLGETAAGLAHEIRNPLGAITLFVSMLKDDLSEQSESLALLSEVEKGIKSLDAVVSNVLHFAQERVTCSKPCNSHSIIQELVQHFASLYSPQSRFEAVVDGNPYFMGDEQGIRQALYNLIINALQAVSFAGSITISAESVNDAIIIRVQDDGPGIPEEIRAGIFDPFTSGRPGGTGLGLSIVRRIIQAHQGTITLESSNQTTFRIRLPQHNKTQEEV
jgi:signal transduction histidine kinase